MRHCWLVSHGLVSAVQVLLHLQQSTHAGRQAHVWVSITSRCMQAQVCMQASVAMQAWAAHSKVHSKVKCFTLQKRQHAQISCLRGQTVVHLGLCQLHIPGLVLQASCRPVLYLLLVLLQPVGPLLRLCTLPLPLLLPAGVWVKLQAVSSCRLQGCWLACSMACAALCKAWASWQGILRLVCTVLRSLDRCVAY